MQNQDGYENFVQNKYTMQPVSARGYYNVQPVSSEKKKNKRWEGEFGVEERNGSGRSKVFGDAELAALLEEDWYQTQEDVVLI